MRKRAAAILLALCMALTLLPTAVFATEEGGAAAPVEQPTQQEEKQEGQQEQPEETPEQPEEQPEAKPAEQPEQQQESAAQGGPAVQSNETGIALLADEHKHCICGGSVTAGDHTSHSDVAYQPWNGTDGISYTNNTAYVYLTGNATIGGHLTVDGKTLYLCLNGKTLSSNNTAKIQVENGGRLVLCDCQGGGTFKGATQSVWGGACIYLYTSTLDMFGGKLTGGKVTDKGGGGAIALDDQQCIFNMYGGEISGNNGNNYGGAIFRKFLQAIIREKDMPPKPVLNMDMDEFRTMQTLMLKVQKQAKAIKKIQEVTLPNLRQQLAETTGIFKGKERKALEKQIQQIEAELDEKLDKLPDILTDDGYPDVQAFMKTYRKAEAIVTQYNQDLAEWEQAVKNGQKPAEKQNRPPERQSVRNRLRQLQEEGKQNSQPKQRKKSQDRDR